MGKILKVLANFKLPQSTIFSERFVVECCETYHFHFRNLRYEVSHDDFLRLLQAFKEIETNYLKHGRPRSHQHLELGRALLNPEHSSQELSVELCENVYKKYYTGWDSHFHEEHSFIHLHWRDMRIEMSNAEFIVFGKIVSQAFKKMQSYRYKTVTEVFDLLNQEGIIYAVIRNWDKLPEDMEAGPHSDLDLLIHPDHLERFDDLLDSQLTTSLPYRVQRRIDTLTRDKTTSFILIDLRQPGDNYFPDDLAWRMLNRRLRHKNFWVLHPEDHLIGLAYHILYHKGIVGRGYPNKLRWLSSHVRRWPFSIFQENDLTPYITKILTESHTEYVQPEDLTVQPHIPLLFEKDHLITSRYMQFGKQSILSRVYKTESDEGSLVIIKQTNGVFAKHEFDILDNLKSKYFPGVWNYEQHEGYSMFHEEFINGTILSEAHTNWTFTKAKDFVRQCIELLQSLEHSGIQHRDLRAANLMVTDEGSPVLFDFGWATSKQHPLEEPKEAGLGKEGRPPEGGPYDPYGLGKVILLHIQPLFPEFRRLSEPLLGSRFHKPVDWKIVEGISGSIEEKDYANDEERFITLCMLGRYKQVEPLLPKFELSSDKKTSFWVAYLKSLLKGQSYSSNVRVPVVLLNNKRHLSRLIQECLNREDILQLLPLLNILIRSYKKICRKLDRDLLTLIDRHFNRLLTGVDPATLKSVYEKTHRQEIWLNLYTSYLVDKGTPMEKSKFLTTFEGGVENLSSHACAAIALLYFQLEEYDKATKQANLVLQNDPYFVECARITAISHETRGNVDNAIHWWEHVQTLESDSKEARKHLVELKFQKKVAKKNQRTSPTTDVKTDEPIEIFQNIKQFLNINETDMALSYLERLKQVLPKNTSSDRLTQRIGSKIAERQQDSPELRLLIPPLSEGTYSENPTVVRSQLEKLVKTELGNNPIIKSKHEALMSLRYDQVDASQKREYAEQSHAAQSGSSDDNKLDADVQKGAAEGEKINSLFEIGNNLIGAGKWIEGLQTLSQLLEIAPQHFETLQMLGDLYDQLGKEAEAKHMWELALAQQPNNSKLIKKLGRITTSSSEENLDLLMGELTKIIDTDINP